MKFHGTTNRFSFNNDEEERNLKKDYAKCVNCYLL